MLAQPLAVFRTVFSSKVKFPRYMESRGKFFVCLDCSPLIALRFPMMALVNGDAKVPSLLYYDKSGNVRAAGAEVLNEDVIVAALTEEWTRAEW